jgi:N4-gp56 family major capsid protein
MAIQSFGLTPQRVGIFKGEIIAHATPVEVLGITGKQMSVPKNSGKTVVYRSFLPYGASAGAGQNQWTVDAAAHQTTEGITPPPDSIVPRDITCQIQQYSVLYGFTDQTFDLYEDDIPAEMKKQTGERVGLVREMIRYGVLKAGTNKFYGGTGTTRATVNGKLTIALLRKVTRNLRINHTKMITGVLEASTKIATNPVEAAWLVFVHSDAEADIRDLPGFKHVAEYGNRKTVSEYELGSCEGFRFIISPELASYAGAGAASASSLGLYSVGNSVTDVYPFIVTGEDAWGQVALRGADSVDPTWLPPGQKDKNDPHGQRGYIGAKFYSQCVILNNGYMAIVEAGVSAL